MADELRRPLRRRRVFDLVRTSRPTPLAAATAAVAASALVLVAWLALAPGSPDDGPVVVVGIERPDPVTTATTAPAGGLADDDDPFDSELALPSDEAIAADLALASEPDPVLPRRRPLAPAPIEAVSEAGPFGPLPRIASDGRKPFDLYARAAPVASSPGPRIALVLGGMGLNRELTLQAIRNLPAEVTLAFAPYGDDLQGLVNQARAAGHEVMLHLPMEPFGYPSVDPGPRTLRAGDGAGTNLDNLSWMMSRFAGYTGVVNYMGARLMADEAALKPVLAELAGRGLVYLDNGASTRSLAAEVGQALHLPVRRAHGVIDAAADVERIRQGLTGLEEEARRSGLALGAGTGLPVTLQAVEAWAADLAERGFVLVPASAAFRDAPQASAAKTPSP